MVCIGGRKLIRDRWVGYVAGQRNAELLTQVIAAGSDISLNAKVESGGELRVEVCNERGETLDGFELDQCATISGDGTAAVKDSEPVMVSPVLLTFKAS